VRELTKCFVWKEGIKKSEYNVGYCSLRTEKTRTQHCVQMCTERNVWEGNCTANSYNKSELDDLFLKSIFHMELHMFRTDLLYIFGGLITVYAAIGIFHARYADCLLPTEDSQHK
jgi:hypothetical protein